LKNIEGDQSHFDEFFFFEDPSKLATFIYGGCKAQYSGQFKHFHDLELEEIVFVVFHAGHACGQAEIVGLEQDLNN
jgi:hypothetical protein